MRDDDYSQPLFNALPSAVVALALAIFAVEAVLSLADRGLLGGAEGIGWRVAAIREFSFFPPFLAEALTSGAYWPEVLKRAFAYPFVHGGFAHAAFVIVFLLALGKLVGEVFGNLAVFVLFFACGVFGAFVYSGLTGSERPLIGGYPSAYGLIGAYTFALWVRLKAAGQNEYQAFTLIGFLMALQLFFGIFFEVGYDWVAEIAGFAMGFVLTPALVPGAFRSFLDRLRQR